MQNPRLIAAFALSSLLAACSGNVGSAGEGGSEERVGTQASAIQGGTMDTNAAHSFAVGVANRHGGVCSGTLIAPNLVLTARHCVVPPSQDDSVTCTDTFEPNVAAAALFVTTEPNLYRAKSYYAASEIITPASTAFCGNDIALIILEKNIPATEAQPAIPVVQFNMTDARLGGSITAMGYGITNPSATDSGQRRIRQNIPLLCVPGSKRMDCTGENAKFSDDPAEFVTEGYVCSGDSGGGAFDQRSFENGGTPYVLGALSRGPQTKDKCLAAIYSRTDAHGKLIVDAALKAAALGEYTPAGWTLTKPGSAGPRDNAPPCDGDTCADPTATGPAASEAAKPAASSAGCSVTNGTRGTSGGLALAGLVLAGLVAAGRRRHRAR